ncbi:helix-turn-helix domain-containing protein [Streptomyces sp. NPDC059255]|uniref:helix-turn-helix domain-containing protein n=1 Tax=Streptomyces sp. NPDC059255 TaxID=3346793 RepID=UPI003697A89F
MTYHTWMRFFSPGPVHHGLGLVCLGVGLQRGSLPVVGPRTLDHHVAVVISTGSGWFRGADGRRTTVTAPALLWLTPGVAHHYGPDRPGGWDESFVDFTGPATATYTELGYIEPDRPVVPLSDATGARAAVARIARAARHGNPLLEVETGAAVHELLVALRRARADTDAEGDPVLQALARDACRPLTVAEHAARHGMTPAALRAAVRRASGRSPKDYLLGIRLGHAKELLAATELPVAAVARRVGYDDPAYFSRLFTRRVGLAPVRFRAQQSRTVPGTADGDRDGDGDGDRDGDGDGPGAFGAPEGGDNPRVPADGIPHADHPEGPAPRSV